MSDRNAHAGRQDLERPDLTVQGERTRSRLPASTRQRIHAERVAGAWLKVRGECRRGLLDIFDLDELVRLLDELAGIRP